MTDFKGNRCDFCTLTIKIFVRKERDKIMERIRGYTEEERKEIKKTVNDWIEEQFAKYDADLFMNALREAIKTRKFSLATVLSVITGCRFFGSNLSDNYEIQEFLKFTLGSEYRSVWLNDMMKKCRSCLLEQFPQFATSEFEAEIIKLKKLIDATDVTEEYEKIMEDWIAEQITKHGEVFAVRTKN